MSTLNLLTTALYKRCGYQLINTKEALNQLRLAGRILPDPLNRNLENWLILTGRLLDASTGKQWTIDISKHYFRKGGKTVFEWRIIVQGEDVAQYYDELQKYVSSSPQSSRVEMREMPLTGASKDRNNPAGGKRGAGFTDRMMVGPLAVANRKAGG